ncbi:hypothetical protein CON36_34445 [Bacillus cereus]|uniref:Uncharacterized protein n=1 Tax=Bacillus cereus TaxID=1396 RepID=A0A9X6SSE5_BACCE|nr:hypothetical protein [Bacillus cereus]PDZ94318.1 hypothetical protein CON36_34445 [Bacillus cereus]
MNALSSTQLEKEVLSLFHHIKGIQHFQKGNDAIVVFGEHPMYFAFLSYIPKGTSTTFPTVSESLNGLNTDNKIVRTSNGEWFVESIYAAKENEQSLLNKVKKSFT